MFRTCCLTLIAILSGLASSAAAPRIDRIDPPCWWTGMASDTLQLMVYGSGIASAECTLATPYPGVKIDSTVRLDSPNYLLLYLTIDQDARPGQLRLRFTGSSRRSTTVEYPLLQRTSRRLGSFDASDVLYLVMPDRFAYAQPASGSPDPQAALAHPVKIDRSDPNARHGGNLAGLAGHLDYIDSLGVTAIWVNPVLTNDMPGGSYHGYATTDYYSIDPRFGSNAEWNALVDSAHSRGLKVVMDMIFNHTGSHHPWALDMPSADWYNQPDGSLMTNYRLSTIHDPYASDYDRRRTTDGWFVPEMPDLNQRNPHLMRYLTQNSIWWIESSGIDGIRMDTHPYADFHAMARWIDAVQHEYPDFNIVGECWYSNEGGEAFWQRGSKVCTLGDPRMPTVMDFVLSLKAREAFSTPTGSLTGLNAIYDHLALDYLFPDPQHVLTFLDNHDTDRFLLEEPDSLAWWRQAMAFLLTSRGIPQIYYGTELLMSGSREGSDGYVRRDFPGGFPGDEADAFTAAGRTPAQQEAFDFLSLLLHWRRQHVELMTHGSLKHFMPDCGVYVYQRSLPGHAPVTVIINGRDEAVTIPLSRYAEFLTPGEAPTDILTGERFTLTPEHTLAPRALHILE